MKVSKKRGILFAILLLILDQISKFFIIKNSTYISNTGAAWGILSNSQYLLIIISLIVIFYTLRYFSYHPLALSFLLGGTLGNLTDRIFRKEVIDFINIRIFNYPLFNLADVFITIAITLLIIKTIKEK